MIAYGISEKGNYRRENQDTILNCVNGTSALLLVADGVGGALYGEKVSGCIRNRYGEWWIRQEPRLEKASFAELFEEVRQLAEQINAEVCRIYGSGTAGSTLALLLIHKKVCGVLSVGDSRVYRCDGRYVRCLTRDDILENLPGSRAGDPDGGKLVSAVGVYEVLEYSCLTDRCGQGTVFLLCSDGIYRYVEPETLAAAMKKAAASEAFGREHLERIARNAVEHDTKDNYSAVMIRC